MRRMCERACTGKIICHTKPCDVTLGNQKCVNGWLRGVQTNLSRQKGTTRDHSTNRFDILYQTLGSFSSWVKRILFFLYIYSTKINPYFKYIIVPFNSYISFRWYSLPAKQDSGKFAAHTWACSLDQIRDEIDGFFIIFLRYKLVL